MAVATANAWTIIAAKKEIFGMIQRKDAKHRLHAQYIRLIHALSQKAALEEMDAMNGVCRVAPQAILLFLFLAVQ